MKETGLPRANYYAVWKLFNEFFIKLDVKPETWEERLILFVGFLVGTNKKSTTIRSYVSAIKSVLRDDGAMLNENSYLLSSLTRACRYKNDRVRTRLPIRKPVLGMLLDKIPRLYKSPQPYNDKLWKAMLVTAYYGLFKIGEIAESLHVMKVKDVHIGSNKNKLMFVLHTSKTHWRDVKPQIIKINSQDLSKLNKQKKGFCPFKIIKDYVAVRKKWLHPQEQFFVFNNRQPVTPNMFRSTLKFTVTVSRFRLQSLWESQSQNWESH